MKKLYFEDKGQDFLWWVVDENGVVTDCGPFQASLWVGNTVIAPELLLVGDQPEFISKQGNALLLNYKIEKIEIYEHIQ